MSGAAILLLSISALAHAYWNLRGKSRAPSAAMFLVGDGSVAVMLIPLLLLTFPAMLHFPARFWPLALASGFCEAAYYTGISQAYRTGNLSVIYPIVRSVPVILVAAARLLLGRSQNISLHSLEGMAAIVVGCLLLPPRQRAGWFNIANLWALLAGLASAGYMLIDDDALSLLRPLFHQSSAQAAAEFVPILAISTTFWLAVYVAARPAERAALAQLRRDGLAYAQKTGVIVYFAYGLVLIAMGLSRDVSYVAAFRQISIPIGAMLGIAFLREPIPWPKALGVGLVFAGVVIVALN